MLVLAALMLLCSCGRERDETARALTGGNPERGRIVMRYYGCGSCHTIPGVTGATALVGPSLEGIASRVYVAGMVKNTPENMIAWIRNPHHINPRTAMPEMGVSALDARDIAGYLYTLE
jgi:cytochrome c